MSGAPELAGLTIADDAGAWEALGFDVRDRPLRGAGGRARIGTVELAFAGRAAGEGIVGWSLRGEKIGADLDGLATETTNGAQPQPGLHPNGVLGIDHVVVLTPDLDRTTAALAQAGIQMRRERLGGTPEAPVRQRFFRVGEAILELVTGGGEQMPSRDGPARFWGMVVVVDDLEPLARRLGDRLGSPRDAVQESRRIATLSLSAQVTVPLAFMTPHVRA